MHRCKKKMKKMKKDQRTRKKMLDNLSLSQIDALISENKKLQSMMLEYKKDMEDKTKDFKNQKDKLENALANVKKKLDEEKDN